MIVLAGIGLIVSIVSLLYLTQHLIGLKANEIDKHRSVLSVDGAVQTSVNRVLSLVMDNAIWDDAVHQTYADRLDPQWLYNSWGSGFKINNLTKKVIIDFIINRVRFIKPRISPHNRY